MRRGNRLFYLIIIMLITTGVVTGIVTKNSLINNIDFSLNEQKFNQYTVTVDNDEDMTDIYFDQSIQSFEQLESAADVIVKVKPTQHRVNQPYAVLTKAVVAECYAGEQYAQGDTIYIYEPVNFTHRTYYSQNGYNIMDRDKEYIFFLKHLEVPEGYDYKNNEAITYLPVSVLYAKYNADAGASVEPVHIVEDSTTYESVKQKDLLTSNTSVIKTYQSIRETVLQTYGNRS